jgi:LacI family transcriptional regulator
MAAGLIKELHKRRMSASDDMSVIGMDDVSLASMMTPALTTIKQPFKEISQKTVNMVIRQKEDNIVSDKKIVLEASLVIRETTAEVK